MGMGDESVNRDDDDDDYNVDDTRSSESHSRLQCIWSESRDVTM